MMGGVSPETCRASYKYGIINFDTLLHLVGFFCMSMYVYTIIYVCMYVCMFIQLCMYVCLL